MPNEISQGRLVSSPTNDEDDDEEKLLAISGSLLPSEARAKKLLMEDYTNELEIKDLEEWICCASQCLKEATLNSDLKEEEESLM